MKNRADKISEETERAFDEALKHLQFLKNQFLTNMTINVKKEGGQHLSKISTHYVMVFNALDTVKKVLKNQ